MELEQLKTIVASWAVSQPGVKRVYLFGSAIKGKTKPNDLDIAVEIDEDLDGEEVLDSRIHTMQALRRSLAPLLPLILDLQWYGGVEETPTVHRYLLDGHKLVYERKQ